MASFHVQGIGLHRSRLRIARVTSSHLRNLSINRTFHLFLFLLCYLPFAICHRFMLPMPAPLIIEPFHEPSPPGADLQSARIKGRQNDIWRGADCVLPLLPRHPFLNCSTCLSNLFLAAVTALTFIPSFAAMSRRFKTPSHRQLNTCLAPLSPFR